MARNGRLEALVSPAAQLQVFDRYLGHHFQCNHLDSRLGLRPALYQDLHRAD